MARISPKERERKRVLYDQHIFETFLEVSWSKITYDNIAKTFGVTKSSLQNYYPTRWHFAEALRGRMKFLAEECLDTTNRETLVQSWKQSIVENRIFRESVQLMLNSAANGTHVAYFPEQIQNLNKYIAAKLSISDAESEQLIAELYGYSVLILMGVCSKEKDVEHK